MSPAMKASFFALLHFLSLRSLSMAAVAAGRFDGYWERNLSAWDIAAGIVMIREAGGTVGKIDGGKLLQTGNVVCGNEFVHGELTRILRPLK